MSSKDDKVYLVVRDDIPAKKKNDNAGLDIDIKTDIDKELELEGITVSEELIMRTLNAAQAGAKPSWSSVEIEGLEEELARKDKYKEKRSAGSNVVEMSDVERTAVSKVKRKHRIHVLKNIGYVAAGLLILLIASNIDRIIPSKSESDSSSNGAAMFSLYDTESDSGTSEMLMESKAVASGTGDAAAQKPVSSDSVDLDGVADKNTVEQHSVTSEETGNAYETDDSVSDTATFEGVITEVTEEYIVVDSDVESQLRLYITADNVKDTSKLKAGVKVKVYFNGKIDKRNPARVIGVELIEIVE